MTAVYILILCLSTGLAGWTALRAALRVMPMLGLMPAQTGLCAMVPVIAFLIVVSAPPSLLFFASALMAVFLLSPLRHASLPRGALWLAIATGGTLWLLDPPHLALPASLPLVVIYAASFSLWLTLSTASMRQFYALPETAATTIFACVPLAATPLLLGHASSVATDAAILASGWFGALLHATPAHRTGAAAHVAGVFILGYLQLAACWAGAWESAIASAVIWLLGLLYTRHSSTARILEELTRA